MSSLINKNEVKKFLRDALAKRVSAGQHTRAGSVGSDVYTYIERIVRLELEKLIRDQASRFKRLHDPMDGVTLDMRNAMKPRKRKRK